MRHRILAVNLPTLIVDVTGESRLVTGPRAGYTVHEAAAWREGVAVGLTPLGVSALLGVPVRDLVGRTVALADLPRFRDVELSERLAGAPTWMGRFALLDDHLLGPLDAHVLADGLVARGWQCLQRPGPRVGIDRLAAGLGVSRRSLEVRFQREIGLPPRTVGRIARLQHAVGGLIGTSGLARIAIDSGYADQPHFTRDVRSMTGLTPTELRAFLQYQRLPAQ